MRLCSQKVNSSITTGSDIIVKEKWTIFCDGSWCKILEDGGFAAIALKDNAIVACRIGWVRSCSSLFESEMRGIIAGLEMARELNLHEVDIVSDSVEAVWSFTSGMGNGSQAFQEKFQAVLPMINNQGCIVRHIFREFKSSG